MIAMMLHTPLPDVLAMSHKQIIYWAEQIPYVTGEKTRAIDTTKMDGQAIDALAASLGLA